MIKMVMMIMMVMVTMLKKMVTMMMVLVTDTRVRYTYRYIDRKKTIELKERKYR